MNGTITYWGTKGYGYLKGKTFREQFYFHISRWQGDDFPVVGQAVEFEVEPPLTLKRTAFPQAVNVRPIDPRVESVKAGE